MLRKRKAKHIVQFRGPLRIAEKPTARTFVLVDYFDNKRRFRRHVSNVRWWTGALPDLANSVRGAPAPINDNGSEIDTTGIEVETYLPVVDNEGDEEAHLVRVNGVGATAT